MQPYPQKDPQAKFNAGLAKLERMHWCRVNLHIERDQGNFRSMLNWLRAFWMEINYTLKKEERNKAREHHERIVVLLNNNNLPMAFSELHYFELFLADKEAKYGLGMPEKPDEEDASDA